MTSDECQMTNAEGSDLDSAKETFWWSEQDPGELHEDTLGIRISFVIRHSSFVISHRPSQTRLPL